LSMGILLLQRSRTASPGRTVIAEGRAAVS
jgi:hypothetical protein